MDATKQDTDRRALGQRIGAALRYARAACELNLKGAPLCAVRREAAHALDCLGAVVWIRNGGSDV